jgi:hypothetical protein
MATTGIMVPAMKPVGELCAVLHTIQGEDEPTRDKTEDKEGEPNRDKAEDKEGERNANEGKEEELKGIARHKRKEEGDREVRGKAKRTSKDKEETEARENEKRLTSKGGRNIGEEAEGKARAGQESKVKTEGVQSTGDGGNNTEAQPLGGTTQAMPTPDEAEWASEVWGTVQGKEEAEESLHKFKELHREAMADLKPHQLEMACQFRVLASMGITMPEEDAGNEEWWEPRGSQWNWKENWNNEEVEDIRVGQQVNKAWGHGGAEEDEEGGNWADEQNNVEGVEEEEEWEEGESEAEEQRIIDEGEQWTEE